jgi:hypothetical protein
MRWFRLRFHTGVETTAFEHTAFEHPAFEHTAAEITAFAIYPTFYAPANATLL